MKNVELYYNEDKTAYAVLISKGFGSGWSTWNFEYPEIAYDRSVVAWYLLMNDEEIFRKVRDSNSPEHTLAQIYFDSIGYHDLYFGGLHSDMVVWVPVGSIWRINEYDGAERIEFLDLKEWNQF